MMIDDNMMMIGLVPRMNLTRGKINMEPENPRRIVEENRLPIWSMFRFHVGFFPGVYVYILSPSPGIPTISGQSSQVPQGDFRIFAGNHFGFAQAAQARIGRGLWDTGASSGWSGIQHVDRQWSQLQIPQYQTYMITHSVENHIEDPAALYVFLKQYIYIYI